MHFHSSDHQCQRLKKVPKICLLSWHITSKFNWFHFVCCRMEHRKRQKRNCRRRQTVQSRQSIVQMENRKMKWPLKSMRTVSIARLEFITNHPMIQVGIVALRYQQLLTGDIHNNFVFFFWFQLNRRLEHRRWHWINSKSQSYLPG